jgi:DNA-binding transcriptional regulator LsrR (DeoR family)
MREAEDLSEKEQFLVRTSWLYYVEGMTQNAIAEHLGVTRLKVNRAIQEALNNGIVKISIDSEFTSRLELEKRIKKVFNLKNVSICPCPVEEKNAAKLVGTELARYLFGILSNKSTKLFGIGWGETLNYAVRTIEQGNRPDLEIISAFGTLPRGSGFNSFGVATRLALAFSANCTYLPVPLYSSSKKSRDIILVQEVFKEVFLKIKYTNGMAVSAGDMTPRSLLIRDGIPSDLDIQELINVGAVGDILGYFFDINGNIIDHPISERALGLNPFEFKGNENNILAAGGKFKKHIILAGLQSGIFDTLITDESAAEAVLELVGA